MPHFAMFGRCRSPSYLRLPRGRVVLINCVVRGRNHFIAWSVCQAGCRHLHVALVCKSRCVIILCKESNAVSRVSGPLKAGFHSCDTLDRGY